MLRTIYSYLSSEVWPRRRDIVRGSELWIALAGALLLAHCASGWGIANTQVGEVVTVALAYAAVAFGFCLAGLTVALTLPNDGFVRELATKEPSAAQVKRKGRVPNAYSDLIFVFSWTAVAHWVVIVVGLLVLIEAGYGTRLVFGDFGLDEKIRLGLLSFFLLYAVFQFLITLITLSQVGNRYIDHLRR
ncbi:MAG TPA: hypothetical protein VI039_03670 [Solirubrobacterales bacterium]